MKRRARMAAAALVVCMSVGALPACGSGSGGSNTVADKPSPRQTATAPPPTGCHQYCKQAGGYGGGEAGREFMRVRTKGLIVLAGDALSIQATCLLRGPCRGAVLVVPSSSSAAFFEVGRSDLYVAGESTGTIAVRMSPAALRELDRQGGRLPVEILADYGDPECPPGSILPCVAAGRAVIATSSG